MGSELSQAKDSPDTVAGIPVVADESLRPGVWQLRDGFGSVIWEWDENRSGGVSGG